MTLTQGAGVPNGITFGENWLMVMNTTQGTVTFTIPTPVATNPPGPAIPTVLGPDYSSSNPLALTSYEQLINGNRSLVIPSGSPPTGLMDYSTWAKGLLSGLPMIISSCWEGAASPSPTSSRSQAKSTLMP